MRFNAARVTTLLNDTCNTLQGPPVTVMLKPSNLECNVFMMSRMHQPSMLSLALVFLKKRLAGCAWAAELAARMLPKGSAATRAFHRVIMRRVFGGRGSEAIACSVRAEVSRMFHARPMCKYAVDLQVSAGA